MTASAVDTSILVAATVRDHEYHTAATGPARVATHVLGPVIAETWSVLRRAYRLAAPTVAEIVARYVTSRKLVVPGVDAYRTVLDEGAALRLAGNVHDKIIVETCAQHALALTTSDSGMALLAEDRLRCTLIDGL